MTDTPLPLPHFWEVEAEPTWQAVDFISDLHLSPDSPLTLGAFARYITNTPADAVFILGDLFDVWLGDDSRHEGLPAQGAELLSAGSTQRTIAFMAGNRDFLVSTELLNSCGMWGLADPTVLILFGQRVMLCHGDALCLSDLPYQAFRKNVRSPQWREQFLALPLAQRRELAKKMRTESQRHQKTTLMSDEVDIDFPTASTWMREGNTSVMIHGHTHRPGSETFAPGLVRHVTSDWDLDGEHGHERAQVLRITPGGIHRLNLDQALGPQPAFEDNARTSV